MKHYDIFFSAILCDRLLSNFMRTCGLCDDVGIRQTIKLTTTTEPTEETINKMKKALENSSNEKTLRKYYTCVEFIKIEMRCETETF